MKSPPKPPKFRRSLPYRSTADNTGKVQIMIRLLEPHNSKPLKGNRSRCFLLPDTKVSEVAKAIELALFEEK